MRSVCGVIVTYNRPELLERCLRQLLKQDYPLDILIYDNHSTTDTKGHLLSKGLLTDQVKYVYADDNTGGSGGFHNGMTIAYEAGYDELLLMDDDGYAVNENTVSLLMDAREKVGKRAIVNSLVVCDSENLQLSFSMDRTYDGQAIKNRAENGLFKDWINPFNGTLVSRSVVAEIGYPMKEFFVYGDETEYYLRARSHDIGVYTAVDSLYYHPTNIGDMKSILGFNIAIADVPLWKSYCSVRNSVYFTNKYKGRIAVAKTIARSYLGAFLARGNKIGRLAHVTRGAVDGMRGDFSRALDLTR